MARTTISPNPLVFRGLVARAQVAIRHAHEAPNRRKARRYVNGALVIDLDTHRVTKAGAAVDLTPTEFRLLETLAENAGRVLTHEQLLERVWGYDAGKDTAM